MLILKTGDSMQEIENHPFENLEEYFRIYIENVSFVGDFTQIKTNAIEWNMLCPIYFYLYHIETLIFRKKDFVKNYKKYQKIKEKDCLLYFPQEFIIHYKDGQKGLGFYGNELNGEESISAFIFHLYRTILEFEKLNIPMDKFFTNRIPMFYNLLKIINILEKGYGRL